MSNYKHRFSDKVISIEDYTKLAPFQRRNWVETDQPVTEENDKKDQGSKETGKTEGKTEDKEGK